MSTMDFIVGIIREEFASRGLQVANMYLFGSRAKGSANNESDWDFLVSAENGLSFLEKAKLVAAIQRKAALKHVSVDVIIKSEEKIQTEKDDVGLITYYALKEGVPV